MDWQSCDGIVEHDTGQLTSTLVDLPILPVGGKSQLEMVELIKTSLATHPAELDSSVLHARLAVGCGDGALVRGGSAHRHPSTAAMEALWQAVHPGTNFECTFWDPFHRWDNAWERAQRCHPVVKGIFDMTTEIETLLGMGEGAEIFRGVCEEMGLRARRVQGPGGTRKVVALSGVPGKLLQLYRPLCSAFWKRASWKAAGHGKRSLESILDLSRRFRSPRTATALLLLEDCFHWLMRPFGLISQRMSEPSMLKKAGDDAVSGLQAAQHTLSYIMSMVRVATLLAGHVPPSTIANFAAALCCSSKVRLHFPTFMRGVRDLLGGTCRQCELHVPDTHDPSQSRFLAAFCQCGSQWRCLSAGRADSIEAGPVVPPAPLWPDTPEAVQASARAKATHSIQGNGRLIDPACCVCQIGQPQHCSVGHISLGSPVLAELTWGSGVTQRRIRSKMPTSSAFGLRLHKEHSPISTPARTEYVPIPTSQARPPGFRAQQKFRHRGHGHPHCLVSHKHHLIYEEVIRAMSEVNDYMSTLEEECRAILGSVGVSNTMNDLLDDASVCWDWERLATEVPKQRETNALLRLCRTLRPLLEVSTRPVGKRFENVPQQMPPDKELIKQYGILCKRVRTAASTIHISVEVSVVPPPQQQVPIEVRAAVAMSWPRPEYLDVQVQFVCPRLKATASTHFFGKGRQRGRLGHGLPQVLLSCVSDFVGCPCIKHGKVYMRVRHTEVVGAGHTAHSGMDVGDLVRLKHLRGRHTYKASKTLLRVVGVHHVFDTPAIAAAIDTMDWFALGKFPKQRPHLVAWWVCLAHHRCRVLFPPESPCERVGSVMRHVFDEQHSTAAAMLADLTLLAHARVHCTGGARDDTLVKMVARTLQSTAVYQINYKPRQHARCISQVAEVGEDSIKEGVVEGCPAQVAHIRTVHDRRKALTNHRRRRPALPTGARLYEKHVHSEGLLQVAPYPLGTLKAAC